MENFKNLTPVIILILMGYILAQNIKSYRDRELNKYAICMVIDIENLNEEFIDYCE